MRLIPSSVTLSFLTRGRSFAWSFTSSKPLRRSFASWHSGNTLMTTIGERKYYQNDFQPVTWYLLLLSCTDRSKLSEIGHKWRYGLYIPLGIDPQKNTTLPHQYQVNLSKHYIRDLTYRLVMTHKKTWPFRLLALKSVNTKRNWGNDISRNLNHAWYWPTAHKGISPSCT